MEVLSYQEGLLAVSGPVRRPKKCSLCEYQRPGSSFVCAKCVSNGNFVKSTDVKRFETYASSKKRLSCLTKDIEDLNCRVLGKTDGLSAYREKVASKYACQMRLEVLRQAVCESETCLQGELDKWKLLRKANEKLSLELERHGRRVKRWEKLAAKLQDKLLKTHEGLTQTHLDLGIQRKKLIGQLTTSIFPLCRITPLRSVSVQSQVVPIWDTHLGSYSGVDETDLVVGQLADAVGDTEEDTMASMRSLDSEGQVGGSSCEDSAVLARCRRYRGTQWSNVEYSICGVPSLSYDCLRRCEQWIQLSNVEELSADEGGLPCSSETLSVLAALSHVTHLASLVSKILLTHIPHSIPQQAFSVYTLTPMALQAHIAKLQANILLLCFPLKLPRSLLLPQHVLHNLAMCIELPPQSFAGNRSYAVHSDLLPEIPADWETVDIVREAECGGVVRSSMFDESGELRGDSEFVVEEWETIGPTPVVEVIEETSSSTVDPSESRTGGLFASTLAQVSNIWKAATGQN